MSTSDVLAVFQEIKHAYPQAEIGEEICNATRIRQQAVHELQDVDVLIVVGDKQSNNSTRLAEIGRNHGIPHVLLIDDASQLDLSVFHDDDVVAVTSGASTPSQLTAQVIDKLNGEPMKPLDLTRLL